MKTVITYSIRSKFHTLTTVSYSIKWTTYQIIFRVQNAIRFPSARCILLYIFTIFYRVQFTFAWPSRSTYRRVVDDGFWVSMKQRCVDSENSHVRFNTFGRFSPLYFISHLVLYIINASPFDYESHTITVRWQWKSRWHSPFFRHFVNSRLHHIP